MQDPTARERPGMTVVPDEIVWPDSPRCRIMVRLFRSIAELLDAASLVRLQRSRCSGFRGPRCGGCSDGGCWSDHRSPRW